MKKENKEGKEISKELKEIVIARIDAQMPPNLKISIGSGGSLTKEEMMRHVEAGDEEGMKIVKMHLNFMKAVASGKLTKEISSV